MKRYFLVLFTLMHLNIDAQNHPNIGCDPSPPIAVSDLVITEMNLPIIICICKNDIGGCCDLENDFILQSTTGLNGGSFWKNSDCTVVYNPPLNYVGTDVVYYQIPDVCGDTSAVQNITINIVQ